MKFAIFLLGALLVSTFAIDCNVPTQSKIDCGYMGIDQQQCESKGCCWVPVSQQPIEQIKRYLAGNDTPWCFFAKGDDPCAGISFAGTTPGFDQSWYNGMYNKFMSQIDIDKKGGVVASPDKNTPAGGSYYYHWQRDGGLTMWTFQDLNDYDLSKTQQNMQDYTEWILNVQSEYDPHGQDVRGEPKFELPNGEVYTGGWCRPQNDGPAIRSTALLYFANSLIAAGKEDYIKQYLWTGSSSYNGGAIKFDLDYVCTSWAQNTCDLWEEVQSTDFFWDRMAEQYALSLGAKLADHMGDSSTANKYRSTQSQIQSKLDSSHWNGYYMQESSNRQKDSSVIHAFMSFDNIYKPTDSKISSTIDTLNSLFCYTYQVNQDDIHAGIPGVLYGRYEGDSYCGGNPWQLLSASLALQFYKGSTFLNERGNEILLESEIGHWRKILNLPETVTAEQAAVSFKQAGDAVMYRIYYHVKNDNYRIDEQIDRNTGVQASALSLTWSYANILKALHYRSKHYGLD